MLVPCHSKDLENGGVGMLTVNNYSVHPHFIQGQVMYLVVCTVEHNAGVLSSTGHVFRDVRLSSGRENEPGRT